MGEGHVFACLVHECPDVVADLVANLRVFEPHVTILLYDGSATGRLLGDQLLRGRNVVVHPSPKPMRWGRLHDFAIDSLRYALHAIEFDALTIVDSDQLLIRPGYVERVGAFLSEHPDVGMLGNAPGVQPRTSRIDPVRVAWREPELWRPLLSRLPGGSAAFPHWTFWPSTVFTRRAAVDLVRLFDEGDVQRILQRSRIWATEEIVLPTLVAALGHAIAPHPARYDYVRYRVGYTTADLDRAFATPDVYWIHPIPRILDHPLRAWIRDTIGSRAPRPAADRMTTSRESKEARPDVSGVRGGLDAQSLAVLTTIVDNLRATAEPPRLVAPAQVTHVGNAMRDLLELYGIRDAVCEMDTGHRHGARPQLDTAILDETAGLVGFAEAAMRSSSRLRPGGWLAVAAPSPSAAAIVQCLAAAWDGSTVEQAKSLVAVRKPDPAGDSTGPTPRMDSIRRHVERSLEVEGWLEPDEAALLAVTAAASLIATGGESIVELGSYCGRATVLLGGIAQEYAHGARVHAIDRFDGIVGEAGGRLYDCGSTIDRFRQAIAAARVERTVEPVVGPTAETTWNRPIGLLLVDALHDYANVERDFRHYEPWLDPKAMIGFHDYADYYPGVRRFVNGLLSSGDYTEVGRVRSLIVIRPAAAGGAAAAAIAAAPARDGLRATPVARSGLITRLSPSYARRPSEGGRAAMDAYRPLVSCIMPTYDRRAYVPDAVARFMAQDYPRRELIVVDDGPDTVADLMPSDDRVHYVRIPTRLTIGAKRNLACELASGEIFAHWDDDDWFATWRLTYEVESLLASDADIVGLSTLLYYDMARGQAWRYQFRGANRRWVHDPTFCYRREVWQAERFPDTNFGLDTRYLRSGRQKRVQMLADHRFYIGTIHPGNTSPKNTREASWTPIPVEEVRDLMSRDASAASRSAVGLDGAMQVAV